MVIRMSDSASTLKDEVERSRSIGQDRALSLVQKRQGRVKRDFWKKLKRVIGHIPFAEDLVAAYYCAFYTKTPLGVRATLLGVLLYFIMPVDLIPDFIAGLGYTDDAALLYTAIRTLAAHIKPEHREKARRALDLDIASVDDIDERMMKDITPGKGG